MGDRVATVDMGRKLGAMPPFWGSGEMGPHLTQCRLGRGQPCNKWHLDPSSPLTTIGIGQKSVGYAPFRGRGSGSLSNTMSPGPRPTSIPCGILIRPAVWTQLTLGDCAPFWEGELCRNQTQYCLGRGLPPYQVVSRSIQPFDTNRHGLNIGGLCPLFGGGWVPI